MRTKMLVVLLFVAVCASVLGDSDKAEDGKRGMCLGEFLEKNPDLKEKLEERFQKRSKKWKDHSHRFFNLPSCTLDEDCTKNTICCKTLRGSMKCLNPIFSEKDIKWLHKYHKEKSRNKREEISDKAKGEKRGMCLAEFLEKHPELKEKVEVHFQKKSKKWRDDKGGEEHSKKHHSHRLANCTSDEECTGNTICCKTWSGAMKCKKPIFSEKDIKCLHDDDKDKSRDKREAHVKGHRKGEKHKPREGHGKRFQYEKVHHKGPIKGEDQVDETFIKQGSNRKRKGV